MPKAADVINFVWKFNITYVSCLCIEWQLAATVSLALKEAYGALELRITRRHFHVKLSTFQQVIFVIYRPRKVVSYGLKVETVVRVTLLKIEYLSCNV